MCQIFRVHIFFFSVENFSSLFFSSFIQSNKKKLRQDASNRNPKAMEQPLQGGGSDSTDSGSEESQQLPLALCLRHLTLAGGEEEDAVVEGGGGDCQRCPLPLLLPSDPPL